MSFSLEHSAWFVCGCLCCVVPLSRSGDCPSLCWCCLHCIGSRLVFRDGSRWSPNAEKGFVDSEERASEKSFGRCDRDTWEKGVDL